MRRGAGQDKHGHDKDGADRFKGADHDDGKQTHQRVMDNGGIDAKRKCKARIE